MAPSLAMWPPPRRVSLSGAPRTCTARRSALLRAEREVAVGSSGASHSFDTLRRHVQRSTAQCATRPDPQGAARAWLQVYALPGAFLTRRRPAAGPGCRPVVQGCSFKTRGASPDPPRDRAARRGAALRAVPLPPCFARLRAH